MKEEESKCQSLKNVEVEHRRSKVGITGIFFFGGGGGGIVLCFVFVVVLFLLYSFNSI